MRLIFNKDNNGQEEIKEILAFLNADFKFTHIKSDIELQTPSLFKFIGEAVYNKIADFYESNQEGDDAEQMKAILKNAQLYILLKAYLEYVSNGDIIHGNNGRKIESGEKEKTAWPWQIKMDNAANERRSYRALDRLIEQLDELELAEWKDSAQYKKARSLFLYNTQQLQEVYPINDSGQLYYRLVPFMEDIELDKILAILGEDKFTELKDNPSPDPYSIDGRLLKYCKKIVGFNVLERAAVLLPEEMMDFKVNYRISEEKQEEIKIARGARFLNMAQEYEVQLQRLIAEQKSQDFELDPLHGIKPENKHVNL